MTEKVAIELKDVQETLLLPLWGRAQETLRANPLLRDETALAITRKIDYDFATITRNISEISRNAWIVRSLHIDRAVTRFLGKHPRATVVNLGCGLDTTFERVDNGQIQWYDLDLPAVIELRRRFIPESPRRHLLTSSLLDESWFQQIGVNDGLFLIAAGVLYYFTEDQIQTLLRRMAAFFSSYELIFDAASPLGVKVANRQVIKAGGMAETAILQWGIQNAKTIATWDRRFRIVESYPMFYQMKRKFPGKTKRGLWMSDMLKIMYMVQLQVVPKTAQS